MMGGVAPLYRGGRTHYAVAPGTTQGSCVVNDSLWLEAVAFVLCLVLWLWRFLKGVQ